jgi:hypothetical protein
MTLDLYLASGELQIGRRGEFYFKAVYTPYANRSVRAVVSQNGIHHLLDILAAALHDDSASQQCAEEKYPHAMNWAHATPLDMLAERSALIHVHMKDGIIIADCYQLTIPTNDLNPGLYKRTGTGKTLEQALLSAAESKDFIPVLSFL